MQVPDAKSDLPSVDRLAYLISGDLQDDDLGLWEVVWRLNTLAPAASLDEKIRLARHAVSSLLGHNDLWRGDWPGGPIALLTEDPRKRTLAHGRAAFRGTTLSMRPCSSGSGKLAPPCALVPE